MDWLWSKEYVTSYAIFVPRKSQEIRAQHRYRAHFERVHNSSWIFGKRLNHDYYYYYWNETQFGISIDNAFILLLWVGTASLYERNNQLWLQHSNIVSLKIRPFLAYQFSFYGKKIQFFFSSILILQWYTSTGLASLRWIQLCADTTMDPQFRAWCNRGCIPSML